MPAPQPEALRFMQTRRSHPAKTLSAPAPTRAEMEPLLSAALRVPDHGKLEPWRLIVLARPALEALADAATARAAAIAMPDEKAAKGIDQFVKSPLTVAVIFSPKTSEKTPEGEQLLSAGAVALSLLNAALAAGWGAAWLTGWPAYDETFCRDALGLAEGERVIGFVHIGTAPGPSPERPRPDVAALTEWRGF
ncbi:nitroreductase family protein [Phaeovulum sp.]|uniref:nitroreductase family protein n=1 Tax=Phaeovulum sp. TaxID=2934796 RepID=UPI00356157BC